MSPEELKEKIDQKEALVLLDVREPHEVAICQLANSLHIPMMQIPQHLKDLPHDTPIVIYCHLGIRSVTVIRYLMEQGYTNIYNLDGGIENWAIKVEPEMNRY